MNLAKTKARTEMNQDLLEALMKIQCNSPAIDQVAGVISESFDIWKSNLTKSCNFNP